MKAFWTKKEDEILIEETDEYRQGHRRRDGQLRKHLSSQAWDEISDAVSHRGGNNRSGTACASSQGQRYCQGFSVFRTLPAFRPGRTPQVSPCAVCAAQTRARTYMR